MKKIGKDLELLISNLSQDSDQARINYRAHQVRDRYREVIESVYRTSASMFLEHTNNVYIMNKDGVETLIVYVDESIFAAELNAQRELIKLKLLERFQEKIENFEIYVSWGKYKRNHPYVEEEGLQQVKTELPELSEKERAFVENTAQTVEDSSVRRSFEKAMTADMARKMAENGKR